MLKSNCSAKKFVAVLMSVCLILALSMLFVGCDKDKINEIVNEQGAKVEGAEFKKGTSLIANEVSADADKDSVLSAIDGYLQSNSEAKGYEADGAIHVFDISLVLDNKKVQPSGEVTVTIPVGQRNLDTEKAYVLYHVKDDGTVNVLPVTVTSETISFSTNSFSYFVLAQVKIDTSTVKRIELEGSNAGFNMNGTTVVEIGQASLPNPEDVLVKGFAAGAYKGRYLEKDTEYTVDLGGLDFNKEGTYIVTYTLKADTSVKAALTVEVVTPEPIVKLWLDGWNAGFNMNGVTVVEIGQEYLPNPDNVLVRGYTATPGDNGMYLGKDTGYTIDLGGLDFTKEGTYTITYALKANPEVKTTLTVQVVDAIVRLELDGKDAGFAADGNTVVKLGQKNLPDPASVIVKGFKVTGGEGELLEKEVDYTVDIGKLDFNAVGTYTITYALKEKPEVKATLTVVVEQPTLTVYIKNVDEEDSTRLTVFVNNLTLDSIDNNGHKMPVYPGMDISLEANWFGNINYTFLGWFIQKADGTYEETPITTKAEEYLTRFSGDTTICAMFESKIERLGLENETGVIGGGEKLWMELIIGRDKIPDFSAIKVYGQKYNNVYKLLTIDKDYTISYRLSEYGSEVSKEEVDFTKSGTYYVTYTYVGDHDSASDAMMDSNAVKTTICVTVRVINRIRLDGGDSGLNTYGNTEVIIGQANLPDPEKVVVKGYVDDLQYEEYDVDYTIDRGGLDFTKEGTYTVTYALKANPEVKKTLTVVVRAIKRIELEGSHLGFNMNGITVLEVGQDYYANPEDVSVKGFTDAAGDNGRYLKKDTDYTVDRGGLDYNKAGTYTVTYTLKADTSVKATLTIEVKVQGYAIYADGVKLADLTLQKTDEYGTQYWYADSINVTEGAVISVWDTLDNSKLSYVWTNSYVIDGMSVSCNVDANTFKIIKTATNAFIELQVFNGGGLFISGMEPSTEIMQISLDSANAGFAQDSNVTTVTIGDENLPNPNAVLVIGYSEAYPNGATLTKDTDYTVDIGGLDFTKTGTYTITYTLKDDPQIKATLTVVVQEENKSDYNFTVLTQDVECGTIWVDDETITENGITKKLLPEQKSTLRVYPDTNYYKFLGWFEVYADGSYAEKPITAETSYDIVLTRDMTLCARFEITIRKLTLDGTAAGIDVSEEITYLTIGQENMPDFTKMVVYGGNYLNDDKTLLTLGEDYEIKYYKIDGYERTPVEKIDFTQSGEYRVEYKHKDGYASEYISIVLAEYYNVFIYVDGAPGLVGAVEDGGMATGDGNGFHIRITSPNPENPEEPITYENYVRGYQGCVPEGSTIKLRAGNDFDLFLGWYTADRTDADAKLLSDGLYDLTVGKDNVVIYARFEKRQGVYIGTGYGQKKADMDWVVGTDGKGCWQALNVSYTQGDKFYIEGEYYYENVLTLAEDGAYPEFIEYVVGTTEDTSGLFFKQTGRYDITVFSVYVEEEDGYGHYETKAIVVPSSANAQGTDFNVVIDGSHGNNTPILRIERNGNYTVLNYAETCYKTFVPQDQTTIGFIAVPNLGNSVSFIGWYKEVNGVRTLITTDREVFVNPHEASTLYAVFAIYGEYYISVDDGYPIVLSDKNYTPNVEVADEEIRLAEGSVVKILPWENVFDCTIDETATNAVELKDGKLTVKKSGYFKFNFTRVGGGYIIEIEYVGTTKSEA